MKDLAIILGIRPDVIRASKILNLLAESSDITYDFIWSGQHYSENMKDVFFSQLNLPKPDYEFEIDTTNDSTIVASIIKNTSLYVDSTNDIKGVEILSVLKNVYALVLGIVDAKFNSPNTRFMILTKAFSEIRVFLSILGGKDDTLFLACGFGDLCMTSLHDLSRNRTLGLLVGKGFFNSDYKSNAVILEGLNSIKVLHDLLDENQMKSLPIFSKAYSYFTNPDDSKIEFYYSEFIDYNK